MLPPLLEAQRRTDELLWALAALERPLIQKCMQAKGFTYQDVPVSRPVVGGTAELLALRYGAPRLTSGGALGYYRDPAATPEVGAGPATPKYCDALLGRTLASMNVSDSTGQVVSKIHVGDGCLGQAQAKLFGSGQAYLDFWAGLQAILADSGVSFVTLMSDDRFIHLNGAWSKCMMTRGYHYRTVLDPANSDWESPRSADRERRVAQADAECRNRTGMDTWKIAEIETAIQLAMLEQRPLDVESFHATESQLIELAKRSEANNP